MAAPVLPKGPRSILLQTLNTYLGDINKMQIASLRKYGDTFTMPSLGGAYFITANPEGIKTILTADPETFAVPFAELFEIFPGNGDGSLFKMIGDKHRAARKLLAPPFHGARMRAYGTLMRDVALQWARTWQPGKPFVMQNTTQAITLDIIIRAIFGITDPEHVQRFHHKVMAALDAFVPSIVVLRGLRRNFFGFGPWARYTRAMGAIQQMTMAEVEKRRADGIPREDILSLLLSCRYEDGRPLSDLELFSQLFTFVFAGHETTAITLSWAFYFLHRHPECLQRLREELAPLGSSPDPEAVAKLPYLEAVCNETMRLCPVVPVLTRKLARPLTVLGYELPAGMLFGIGAFMAHMRPEVYPEPESFRPDRFLNRTYSPFEFLPFGGGARRCLGAGFAMYEMKIVLAALLTNYRFRCLETRPVPPVMRAATVGPRGGIRMMMES